MLDGSKSKCDNGGEGILGGLTPWEPPAEGGLHSEGSETVRE